MRKNKFLTFLFSIIPGCGHMYLGYMKRGAEFMAMFAATIYFSIIMIGFSYRSNGIEMIGVFFFILMPIIWLYQMFDSMHTISQMRRLEIEVPEDDGFFIPGFSNVSNPESLNFFKKRKVVKVIAGILICVGGYLLIANISDGIYRMLYHNSDDYWRRIFSSAYDTIRNYVPAVIISVVLMFAGVKLLAGSKKENKTNNNNAGENEKIADGGEDV